MSKRSYIESIRTKQSSAYKMNRQSAPAIHQIDGSSRREAGRSTIQALKSWTIGSRRLDESSLDRMAEQAIEKLTTNGWSKKLNPICESCWTMKSRSGVCSC